MSYGQAEPVPLRNLTNAGQTAAQGRRHMRKMKPSRGSDGYLPVSGSDDEINHPIGDVEDTESHVPQPPRRKRSCLSRCVAWLLVCLCALLLANALFLWQSNPWSVDEEDPDEIFGHWGQPGSGTEGIAWYPTDFLRDVVPIPCHSHNDYWRRVPLFSAIHVGCTGVEADVWLKDGDLYVGHDPAALQRNRTFQSLYVKPLVELLERQNPSTEFYNETRRGIFDTNPEQTLTLLVDVKTNGSETWPWVMKQVEPLRARGWLSFVENSTFYQRPITLVGTGETPYDQIIADREPRDAFYDAPLDKLDGSSYDSTNSYYTSTSILESIGWESWLGVLRSSQLEKLRAHVKEAHKRGLKARYWELPPWPIHIRNRIWRLLIDEGVDILNVDDLKSAAHRDWSRR